MKRSNVSLLAVCFLLLATVASFAQTFTGTIRGSVRDSSGAVVPNTSITVSNMGTGIATSAQVDASGNYVVPLLPPGQYSVQAEADGFKKFIREGITLQIQQQASVDIVLEIGAVAESVVVSADAELVEATSSSVGKVVDNRRIMDLPLNTRNVYSLIYLTPGVSGNIGNTYNSLSYSVNGARQTMMDTLIDGVSASAPTVSGYAGISVFPSVDAIAEFKVQAGNYSAEFGRSAGSVLNVVYKSGTNDFHGSAYEFLRNSVLDANNFFDNSRGVELLSFKRSQFGGMLSGPIVRNKTFFMGSFEGLRQRSFSSTLLSVPTAAERQADFSQTLTSTGQMVTIFDPFSLGAGGAQVRTPFAENRIPNAMIDPVAARVLGYFPEPNTPGLPFTNKNNFYKSGSPQLNTDNYDVRIDHNFTDTQRFFARYSHRLVKEIPPLFFPEAQAAAQARSNTENRGRNIVAEYSNALSPTSIFTGRVGFARALYVLDNQSLGFLPSSLGLPTYLDSGVDALTFPRFGVAGYATLGGADHRWNAFMTYTSSASWTKTTGSHVVKVGFEGRMFRVNNLEASRNSGYFGFSPLFTQGPNPNVASASAGNGLASFLLGAGDPGNYMTTGGWQNSAAQSFYYAGYIQDDWRATQRLTFNIGLRYDYETPRTERYNRMNYFDPDVASPLASVVPGYENLKGGLVFVGVNGQPRTQFHRDRNNFGPRLGLAYQLGAKTAIRAGYAHLYASSRQVAQSSVGRDGFRVDQLWLSTLDNLTPHNLLRDPYPGGLAPIPGASNGLMTQVGATLLAPLQESPTPWTQQWNLTIQREIPGQILLETAYVGTRGLQLDKCGFTGCNLNQLDPRYLSLGASLNDLVDNPFYGYVTTGVLATPKVSRSQLLRPYPQFTNFNPLYPLGASSIYHGLQVTVKKRMSHGLMFEGFYTWAKNIDDGMEHQDSYNIRASRSLTDLDISHRAVISYIYELPFGRGKRFGSDAGMLTNALLGGWQLNGITTFSTGTPLVITASNTSGIFNIVTRANNNGKSAKLSGPVHERLNRYFDTSVFSQPAPFTFGNASRSLPDVRNDGIRNFDLSLFKQFQPVERMRVQFRAEMLNAFNTPRFGAPNTSVTSTAFGTVATQANAPRQVQFGLKLLW
jgi:outer membrane receptor protein involved in Fe transport